MSQLDTPDTFSRESWSPFQSSAGPLSGAELRVMVYCNIIRSMAGQQPADARTIVRRERASSLEHTFVHMFWTMATSKWVYHPLG